MFRAPVSAGASPAVSGPAGSAGASAGAGAHQGVGLVDKEVDRLFGCLDFVDDALEPFFEFALDPGAGFQEAHVEPEEGDAPEHVGHVVFHDPEGEALHHGGLAHAGLPHADGVVFPEPGLPASAGATLDGTVSAEDGSCSMEAWAMVQNCFIVSAL